MTTSEMDRLFDILYDNISTNQAPGLNKFEKSVFLTKAQDEKVRGHYGPYNPSQMSFEKSEDRRRELNELVTNYSTTNRVSSNIGLSNNSIFFEIPDNVYYIVQEQVRFSSSEECLNEELIKVIPITHDEYNIQKDSPFRKPNKRKVWRLDISSIGNTKVVEIISENEILTYNMRYIKQPLPIILCDIESDPELAGMGLTIDGLNTETPSELSAEVHRDIVDRAVELAIRSLRENTLQANVELNKRNV